MYISEVNDFCEYQVYEYIEKDGKKEIHYICLCKEYKIATIIAKMLAMNDVNNDHYFVSSVSVPNTLVIGGGWHEEYWKDKETGKLKMSSLE